jgi:hypothetical protein
MLIKNLISIEHFGASFMFMSEVVSSKSFTVITGFEVFGDI